MGDFLCSFFGRGCGDISANACRPDAVTPSSDDPAEGHDYDTGEEPPPAAPPDEADE